MTRPEKIVDLLRGELPGLVAVYRFGSSVDGTARPDSDLDIAVLCAQALSPRTRYRVTGDLEVACGRAVDLIDLFAASTVMRAQIVSSGQRLFCADVARCEAFEDFALSSYARLNEERAAILQDVKARETIYG